VYALRLSDGSVAWRFITGGPVYSSPAATAGRVVFGSADGTIYCLQAASGAELWRVRTGAPVVACPIVDHGVVYVGGSDRVFRALDLRSGSVIWKFTGLTGFVETRPLLYLDRVVFGSWDEHLYALNIADGTLSWSWKGDRPGVLYSPAACWPVAAHGRVTIVAPDRMMTMIDARSGAQVWRSGAHQVRESIGISEDGERVYVRTMQDSILCMRTREAVPTPLWLSDLHFGYDINSAMLVEKNGTLFYGTKNGLIMALDAETGRVVWEHREGPGLVNTLLPLSANRVVLTDSDGRVMLLEGGGRGE
jgi:outer membrane protein assembly factor BamB